MACGPSIGDTQYVTFTAKTITTTVLPTFHGHGAGIEYEVHLYVGLERRLFVTRRTHVEATYTETHYRKLYHRLGEGVDREEER
jgi:hypothetical protein